MIEDVVNEKFTLKKTGRRFIGTDHDSLVVIPNAGFYFWNSRGETWRRIRLSGGTFRNWKLEQSKSRAVYGIVRWLHSEQTSRWRAKQISDALPTWAERQLVQRLHEKLAQYPTWPCIRDTTARLAANHCEAARIGLYASDKHSLL